MKEKKSSIEWGAFAAINAFLFGIFAPMIVIDPSPDFPWYALILAVLPMTSIAAFLLLWGVMLVGAILVETWKWLQSLRNKNADRFWLIISILALVAGLAFSLTKI